MSLVSHSLYGGVLIHRPSVSENEFVKFRAWTDWAYLGPSLLAFIATSGPGIQRDTSGQASVIRSYQYLIDNSKDNLFLINLILSFHICTCPLV